VILIDVLKNILTIGGKLGIIHEKSGISSKVDITLIV
jgi:hypothetical protein